MPLQGTSHTCLDLEGDVLGLRLLQFRRCVDLSIKEQSPLLMQRPDFEGQFILPMEGLMNRSHKRAWFALMNRPDKPDEIITGAVELEMRAVPFSEVSTFLEPTEAESSGWKKRSKKKRESKTQLNPATQVFGTGGCRMKAFRNALTLTRFGTRHSDGTPSISEA